MPDHHADLPRTQHYDRAWVLKNSLGENAAEMTESLTQVMQFKPGMRVLDLGCGNAVSSIFLAKEFGVTVWALDTNVEAADNLRRIEEMSCSSKVFPLQLSARTLPFAKGYFDAVIAVDSYLYYGTDDSYLKYLIEYVVPSGSIGIIDACFREELSSLVDTPDHLKKHFVDLWSKLHSIEWWQNFWEASGLVDVLVAEEVPAAARILKEYTERTPHDPVEATLVDTIGEDRGEMLTLFRMVARKR
jgi:cyclopropane fatty-acyl-phospholipid synthase-like methyltransferase